jgi:hypothetical protein
MKFGTSFLILKHQPMIGRKGEADSILKAPSHKVSVKHNFYKEIIRFYGG